MCGRPFGTWRSAARPHWAGTSPSAITAARYGTTIIPAATEAVLSAVGASGRPGWPNVRPTSCPFPTSTSSSPCPTSSAHWYWATVSSCIGCSLTAQGDSSGGGGRPQAPGSADRGADGVAHLGAEAGTSSSRSLCRARRRVGDPRQVPREAPRLCQTTRHHAGCPAGPTGSYRSRCWARSSAASTWRPCARPTKPANSSSLGAPCPWRARRLGRPR